MQKYIKKYLSTIKGTIPHKVKKNIGYIDLEYELYRIVHTNEWGKLENNLGAQLGKKIDITKKYETKYKLDWKKQKDAELLSSFHSSLASLVLYVSFKKLQEINASIEELLKRMNSILKSLDISGEEWIIKDSTLYQDIQNDFQSLLKVLPLDKACLSKKIVNLDYGKKETKIIPITILYSEGPIARAYLEIFKSLGLKPRKIINMVSSLDVASRKPVAKWLPLKYRTKYASFIEESKINYWPRQIEKKYPELQKEIFTEVNEYYNISLDMLSHTTKKINLLDYCDNMETILVKGLSDSVLTAKLTKINEGAILYTGGGIVPSSLLSINNTKFLHIHPGYLPDIKGADCTLYSSMIFGRASASCFYMSPGIDTGDVIMSRWMPKLSFNIDIDKYSEKTLYRAIYSFFDPWVRAVALREVLSIYSEFERIETVSQDKETGFTYYFMHEKMKSAALNRLF